MRKYSIDIPLRGRVPHRAGQLARVAAAMGEEGGVAAKAVELGLANTAKL